MKYVELWGNAIFKSQCNHHYQNGDLNFASQPSQTVKEDKVMSKLSVKNVNLNSLL